MPPKKSDSEPQALTGSELRFIKAVFDHMTQKPDADWGRVAEVLSLKDAKCAKERWRQMSVRHGWRGETASPRKSASTDKVTKKAKTPRKNAIKEDNEDDDDDEAFKDEI